MHCQQSARAVKKIIIQMIPHIGVHKYASAHKPIAYIHTPNYVYFYAYVDKEISITHTQTRTHMHTHTHTHVQMVQRPQRTDSVNAILKDEMSICNRCVPQYRQKRDKISTPIFWHKYIETGFCTHTHTVAVFANKTEENERCYCA